MRAKTLIIGAALAAGVVAGGSAIANAEEVYENNYNTYEACDADGKNTVVHPDWKWYECRQATDGSWNLIFSTN